MVTDSDNQPTAPGVWVTRYLVTEEAINAYCLAVGETHPWCLDARAAKAAGFSDVVAPPMFASVYAAPAILLLQADRSIGFDARRAVHGGQTFEWDPEVPVVAGELVTTTATFAQTWQRATLTFFAFETRSVHSDGRQAALGEWTAIVRGS